MSFLYGRLARLTVGVPGQPGKQIDSFIKNPKTGYIEQGLRFSFHIEKTAEPSPNKATIEVYNLNKDSLALLKKDKCKVVLEVGYGNILNTSSLLEVLFKGDAVKTKTVKKGPDSITTIEAGDGLTAFQDTIVNQSFAPGTPVQSVMNTVLGKFGLATGEQTPVAGTYENGVTVSGMGRDVLDKITGKTGSEWSIQDGAMQIIPVNEFTSLPVIVLTPNTGLIGSPNISGFQNSKDKKNAGLEFVSLIIPGIKPGRRVKIESRSVKGVFVVRKVVHKGDTRSGPWHAECEAVQ